MWKCHKEPTTVVFDASSFLVAPAFCAANEYFKTETSESDSASMELCCCTFGIISESLGRVGGRSLGDVARRPPIYAVCTIAGRVGSVSQIQQITLEV